MYEVMEHVLIGSRISYLYSMVSMVKCRLKSILGAKLLTQEELRSFTEMMMS